EKNSVAFYLSSLACLAVIIALLITLIVEVPIDNEIRTWTATTIPSDWTMIRARWECFHAARTFVSLGSLASFIVAVLISKKLTCYVSRVNHAPPHLRSFGLRDDYVEQTGPKPGQSAAGSARDGAQSDDAGRLSGAENGQSKGGSEPEIHKE